MIIGYARVSTDDQSTDLQIDALTQAGCETIFLETGSGGNRNRPVLGKLLSYLRNGDVLVVWKLDRLARPAEHLIEISDKCKTLKVAIKSLKDPARLDAVLARARVGERRPNLKVIDGKFKNTAQG